MSANDVTVETLLRAHAPSAPERLRARVLALEPAPARRVALPPRRLVFVALPAALAIAVAAAVVHGVARPEKNPAAHRFSATTATDSAVAGGAATQQEQLRSAKAAAPSIQSSRLAHTDASLRLRVADGDALSDATSRATQIATSLGGYAKSVQYSDAKDGGEATIDLRVPSANVKTAVARLSELGTIVSQQLSVTDLQDRFKRQSEQIAQLKRRVAALRAALANPSLTEADKVLLRLRLTEAKRALAQRRNAQSGTVKAAANASISLVIATEKAAAAVPHARGRLDRMLHSALGFLALEAMIALYVLIVISPFAIAAGLVWLWRRRSVDRLLSSG
jgi:hypothetical protein